MKGKPTFQHSVFYPRAIPQYNVGYGRYRELMTDIEQKAPGLFFAGHYRDGISLSDTIVSGCNAADRVGQFLSRYPSKKPSLIFGAFAMTCVTGRHGRMERSAWPKQ